MGEYSQINCELILLQSALDNGYYEYFHLISESDLIVKNVKEIHKKFSNNLEYIDFNIVNKFYDKIIDNN